ncbi:DUF3488 domain-containing protein [Sulfurimonas sp. SAG-AH-194-C21]|nr:DUF3488 and transglutaminase-like domain-containing protein [Sulfurimonas sp. SAG-AH-194-C21]MDF1884423.1 DUF3488 domain-containing protein [Sulfurimonas sp. SAG-AH-194-C21]
MKYLQKLLHTKAPSNSKLLDIAIVMSIVPHVFVMKFFMLLYLAIALFFILKKNKKTSDRYILMLIGLSLISISFLNNYNFSDFSRMQFFVSLVSSLLIYAVTLQKLTQEVNIYLKISPAMLMVLSFFFFNSITMLLYSTFTIFVFTLLYIWSKMDTYLLEVLKFTSRLFIVSLPLVVILFLVFPRVSFEKTDFGFRADKYIQSGYDGKMTVGDKEIHLSNRIIMEVFFKNKDISDSQLYFRGTTLSILDALEWKQEPTYTQADRLIKTGDIINYAVTIYPHAKNWIYTLDMPTSIPSKTSRLNDYTISSDKPIYQIKKFQLSSALTYKLYSSALSNKLTVDKEKSERTYKALAFIQKQNISPQEKAQALLNFFKQQKLSYTLKPINTDLSDFTDSFLFESKNGYCIHFASAFASCARMLGIPSRIVTGFKAEKTNMIKNYLLVKASDAHAWVELYFEKEGWVRFDPTTIAIINLSALAQTQNNTLLGSSVFSKVNHYHMYSKYIISNWILDYNRTKQMAILHKLLNDTIYLLKVVFSFLLLILVSTLLYFGLKMSACKDKVLCEMQKLLKVLEKYDLEKQTSQTMESFLKEAEEKLNISFIRLNEIYNGLKYKKEHHKSDLLKLKHEIKRLTKEIKKASR